MSASDPDWVAVHGELQALHIRKSSTYGDVGDRLANFTAVAAATGAPPERYVLERMHEKTTRALNMIDSGQALEVREYQDLASLGIVCEAFLRRRRRHAAAPEALVSRAASAHPSPPSIALDPFTLSSRLEELAALIAVVGLPDSCEAFDVDREAAESELVASLRLAAEYMPVRAQAKAV